MKIHCLPQLFSVSTGVARGFAGVTRRVAGVTWRTHVSGKLASEGACSAYLINEQYMIDKSAFYDVIMKMPSF